MVLTKLLLDVTVIKIIPTGQNNSEAKGVNVHISEISKNNKPINLEAIKPEGWYTIWDSNIENYGNNNYPLLIQTKRYDSLQITFFNNPYMGIVEIETPKKNYRLDLYTENAFGSTVIDIPFATSRNSSWLLSILAGTFASLIALIFFRFYFHIKSSKIRFFLAATIGCAGGLILIRSRLDYGQWVNCALVGSYGVFAGVTIPNMLQQKYKSITQSFPTIMTLLLISTFATIASLYTQWIRPFYNFHLGVFSVVQFVVFFIYWLLCMLIILDKVILVVTKHM